MYKAEKEVIREPIIDCLGNEVLPGNIIAYASGTGIKFGVYEGIAKVIKNWRAKSITYRVQICTARHPSNSPRRQVFGEIAYDGNSFKDAENIVAVRNPLFCLHNKKIAHCLRAIDYLKDEGILPNDYKLK